MYEFLLWLEETPMSRALIESLYMWPLVESTHVLSIALFVGTTAMMDLRLLGASFRGVPASEFTSRMLPWTRIGFGILIVTGLLLFYSSPIRYFYNFFFRVKMIALVIAGINVWLFHSRVHRRVSEWDVAPVPPQAARVAAIVSLAAWAFVVVTGRLIAYNWFECALQPSPFIYWAAGCSALVIE
jgi:hypothetical protein